MYPSVRESILLWGSFPTIKEGLDAIGLDAVELEFFRDNTVMSLTEPDARFKLDTLQQIDEFKKHLAGNNVRVSALLMHNDFGNPDFDAEVRWTVDCVRAADALGLPAVRIDAIMHGERDVPVQENARVFADAMLRVIDATPDSRVEMGIENHGFQGNNPDFLDLVIGSVGSPRLGMTIDTGNFYWRGHPLARVYEIIEHFAPHCKHTHAKNIAYPADQREIEREIGWDYMTYVSKMEEGDIDHERVVAILKAAGYDRDLCLEDESLGKYDDAGKKQALIDDAAYFKSIL